MKTPIELRDIRSGDLIRWESDNIPGKAAEYIATGLEIQSPNAGRLYLLDRPEPTVELPTEPTLGWIHFMGDSAFGSIQKAADEVEVSISFDNQIEGSSYHKAFSVKADLVTTFTPAVAVPTEALDALRTEQISGVDSEPLTRSGRLIRTFLAAVDAANGGTE